MTSKLIANRARRRSKQASSMGLSPISITISKPSHSMLHSILRLPHSFLLFSDSTGTAWNTLCVVTHLIPGTGKDEDESTNLQFHTTVFIHKSLLLFCFKCDKCPWHYKGKVLKYEKETHLSPAWVHILIWSNLIDLQIIHSWDDEILWWHFIIDAFT